MALIDDAAALYTLIGIGGYAIGPLIPGVTVREVARDEVGITLHPVENGAAVSDHAFILPCRLDMECGWSNSTAGYVGYTVEIYEYLRALKDKREPFDVITPDRIYRNMLIRSLAKATDEKTSSSLMISVSLQEVLITDTSGSGAPNSAQAFPERTGSVLDRGTQVPVDAGIASLPGLG